MSFPVGQKTNGPSNRYVLPNAAIAWKQPNGFYYPPAFHSRNLAFQNVDIRHFVVEPLREPGDFTQFTGIDRATELSDDNGSLTGLVSGTPPNNDPSISVNKDAFFNAPLVVPECASSAPGTPGALPTADTSPYQYVTTAIYPRAPAMVRASQTGLENAQASGAMEFHSIAST